MTSQRFISPDHTSIRVALWRALHLLIDEKPHVISDDIGAKIINEADWINRPDMDPNFSKPMRASIVGRTRFIEDFVDEQVKIGIDQYIILGAGLDTFAIRRPDLSDKLNIFEIDKSDTQVWKQERINQLKINVPINLHFVSYDFEEENSWIEALIQQGFDINKPTIVASVGVSMYLTKLAIENMFKQISTFKMNSSFLTTFLLLPQLLNSSERSIMEFVIIKASESGTPFKSLFSPEEIELLSKTCGFNKTSYISAKNIYNKYFLNREDGLRAGDAEGILISWI